MYSLHLFADLPNTMLEDIEKLEQLRALYSGYKIAMKKVKTDKVKEEPKPEIIEDLERALKIHRL